MHRMTRLVRKYPGAIHAIALSLTALAALNLALVACGGTEKDALAPRAATPPGAAPTSISTPSLSDQAPPPAAAGQNGAFQPPVMTPAPLATARPVAATPAPDSVAGLAPDFTLPAVARGEVTLSKYQGESNVLLVFYRAWW